MFRCEYFNDREYLNGGVIFYLLIIFFGKIRLN